jgi:hypothetical protein
MKKGLQKYGLQKGHTWNRDLQLPWLIMGYKFNRQVSLSAFSPYFLLFGHEPKLLVSIWWDVMVIINLDDLNVWIQMCEYQTILFWDVMPMAMRIWQLPKTKIHCVIPLFVEVVIGFLP